MTSSIHFKTKYPLILYALKNDTLPELLKKTVDKNNNIKIIDFKQEISNLNLKQVYSLYKKTFPNLSFFMMCYTYLNLHKDEYNEIMDHYFLETTFDSNFTQKFSLQENQDTILITEDEYKFLQRIKTYTDIQSAIKHLDDEINRFKNNYKNSDFINLLLETNNILTDKYTKLLSLKLSSNFSKKLEEIRFVCDNITDLNEIFDSLQLDKYFLFQCLKVS